MTSVELKAYLEFRDEEVDNLFALCDTLKPYLTKDEMRETKGLVGKMKNGDIANAESGFRPIQLQASADFLKTWKSFGLYNIAASVVQNNLDIEQRKKRLVYLLMRGDFKAIKTLYKIRITDLVDNSIYDNSDDTCTHHSGVVYTPKTSENLLPDTVLINGNWFKVFEGTDGNYYTEFACAITEKHAKLFIVSMESKMIFSSWKCTPY